MKMVQVLATALFLSLATAPVFAGQKLPAFDAPTVQPGLGNPSVDFDNASATPLGINIAQGRGVRIAPVVDRAYPHQWNPAHPWGLASDQMTSAASGTRYSMTDFSSAFSSDIQYVNPAVPYIPQNRTNNFSWKAWGNEPYISKPWGMDNWTNSAR